MWYSFLAAEIARRVEDKDEIYNQRDDWKCALAMITPVNDQLKPQIAFFYKLLTEDEKNDTILMADNKRKRVGPDMARHTEPYANFIAEKVLEFLVTGKALTARALENWDAFCAHIFPYNPQTNKKLRFIKSISLVEHQNVFMVTEPETNTKWVLKWDSDNKDDDEGAAAENPEAAAYSRLEELGAQCPQQRRGFYVANIAVLVMEFLQPVDVTDNPIEVGRQLLTTQLKYIHTFGCHFDIKLDNIRKRVSAGAPLYFIIDMDLDTKREADGGYKRTHYSAAWTSQSMPPGITGCYTQLSSYRNDLAELCYVVHQLIAQQAYVAKYDIFATALQNSPQHLAKFGLKAGDTLADPVTMAQDVALNNTARGWRAMRKLLEFPMSITTARITCGYMQLVERLPLEPPANIHDRLAQSLDMDRYMDMRTRMAPKQVIECRICSYIGAAYRCGDCYHETTFLCSQACGKQHKCK
jgi:hypothetical protein